MVLVASSLAATAGFILGIWLAGHLGDRKHVIVLAERETGHYDEQRDVARWQ